MSWSLYDADGILVAQSFADLPPYGNILRSDPYGGPGRPVVAGWAEIWTGTFGGSFLAYGSVLDNATSDPTTSYPSRPGITTPKTDKGQSSAEISAEISRKHSH